MINNVTIRGEREGEREKYKLLIDYECYFKYPPPARSVSPSITKPFLRRITHDHSSWIVYTTIPELKKEEEKQPNFRHKTQKEKNNEKYTHIHLKC